MQDFKENYTDATVSFAITAAKEKIDGFWKSKDGLHRKIKLISSTNTANMHLFDEGNEIV